MRIELVQSKMERTEMRMISISLRESTELKEEQTLRQLGGGGVMRRCRLRWHGYNVECKSDEDWGKGCSNLVVVERMETQEITPVGGPKMNTVSADFQLL